MTLEIASSLAANLPHLLPASEVWITKHTDCMCSVSSCTLCHHKSLNKCTRGAFTSFCVHSYAGGRMSLNIDTLINQAVINRIWL